MDLRTYLINADYNKLIFNNNTCKLSSYLNKTFIIKTNINWKNLLTVFKAFSNDTNIYACYFNYNKHLISLNSQEHIDELIKIAAKLDVPCLKIISFDNDTSSQITNIICKNEFLEITINNKKSNYILLIPYEREENLESVYIPIPDCFVLQLPPCKEASTCITSNEKISNRLNYNKSKPVIDNNLTNDKNIINEKLENSLVKSCSISSDKNIYSDDEIKCNGNDVDNPCIDNKNKSLSFIDGLDKIVLENSELNESIINVKINSDLNNMKNKIINQESNLKPYIFPYEDNKPIELLPDLYEIGNIFNKISSITINTVIDVFQMMKPINKCLPKMSKWTPKLNAWIPNIQEINIQEINKPIKLIDDSLENKKINIFQTSKWCPPEYISEVFNANYTIAKVDPMDQLIKMGFANRDLNIHLIEKCNNNLEEVIKFIVDGNYEDVIYN